MANNNLIGFGSFGFGASAPLVNSLKVVSGSRDRYTAEAIMPAQPVTSTSTYSSGPIEKAYVPTRKYPTQTAVVSESSAERTPASAGPVDDTFVPQPIVQTPSQERPPAQTQPSSIDQGVPVDTSYVTGGQAVIVDPVPEEDSNTALVAAALVAAAALGFFIWKSNQDK